MLCAADFCRVRQTRPGIILTVAHKNKCLFAARVQNFLPLSMRFRGFCLSLQIKNMSVERNEELRLAWNLVEHTDKSVFLTGKAGTGKTTFLKEVVRRSDKQVVVVAPTGVAAMNAGGVTMHSFFQLPFTPYVPGSTIRDKYKFSSLKRKVINSMDLLVIDEVSMVRADLLDAVSDALQRHRHSPLPFGGVQLLMIGDLQQLTPVVTPSEEDVLKTYYDTPYFFGCRALSKVDYVTIELTHVYRQQDAYFIDILNHIREGILTDADMRTLNSRWIPDFVPPIGEGYIRLTTHNRQADTYNEQELGKLPTKAATFKAEIEGTFPEYMYPTDILLTLKIGAQVMFIKNDPTGERRYYNGRIGRVVDMEAGEELVTVRSGEDTIYVKPVEWENATYKLNEETKEIESTVAGKFRQIPLRLAWAITIHKSQGLTFDKAIIDAWASFAPGQVYVALSRCRSLSGLVLASQLRSSSLIIDPTVTTYIAARQGIARQSVEQLPAFETQYFRRLLCELFEFKSFVESEEQLVRVLVEYVGENLSPMVRRHDEIVKTLREDIDETARKWIRIINGTSEDDLHGTKFLDRVRRSCTYFRKRIVELMTDPIAECRKIKIKNKVGMKRYKDALSYVLAAYLMKKHVFGYVADNGFDMSTFLKYRQRARVLALEGKETDDE